MLFGSLIPIDLIVYTHQEIDDSKETDHSFVKEVLNSGKTVYERAIWTNNSPAAARILFRSKVNGKDKYFKEVEFFGWEKIDSVEKIQKEFGL